MKFWPTYRPFFCETNFLGLGNPVRKSVTPACLNSLKILPIDLPSRKPDRAKLGHLDCYFKIFSHFKVFFWKRFDIDRVPLFQSSVCIFVCPEATGHSFWARDLKFGTHHPCKLRKNEIFVISNFEGPFYPRKRLKMAK